MPDFSITTALDNLSKATYRVNPLRWDKWLFFTSDLGIDIHDKGVRREYFDRNSDIPYKTTGRDGWMKLGDAYLSTGELKLKLHPTIITTNPINSLGVEQSAVFAFMTHQERIRELLVKVRKGKSYVKCFCLWGEFAIYPVTLIQNQGRLNSDLSNKTKNRIRQFLKLETSTWYLDTKFNDYDNLVEEGQKLGFDYGDLIEVKHPARKEKIPGVIVGDPAVVARESREGLKPQILFLRLIDTVESDSDSENRRYIPTNIYFKNKNNEKFFQSIALTEFRFAPLALVKSLSCYGTYNKQEAINVIKQRLEVFFEK